MRIAWDCALRKALCVACVRVATGQCGAAALWQRVTLRLARHVYELCRLMSVAGVARHVGLDWKAVRAKVPHAAIVFDPFHVIKAFGRVVGDVRIEQADAACAQDREVYKGSKYLLLKNGRSLKDGERPRLKKLLKINATLCTALILRDALKKIWHYCSRAWAARALDVWLATARGLGLKAVDKFCRMLEAHREGILAHCRYPIHTSKLEGVNNRIKLIKRCACGFHDLRYFEFKVIQAFRP